MCGNSEKMQKALGTVEERKELKKQALALFTSYSKKHYPCVGSAGVSKPTPQNATLKKETFRKAGGSKTTKLLETAEALMKDANKPPAISGPSEEDMVTIRHDLDDVASNVETVQGDLGEVKKSVQTLQSATEKVQQQSEQILRLLMQQTHN